MNPTPYLRPSFRCIFAALLLAAAAGVHAQANDDWANRTPITTLPFEIVTPMGSATNDATDPVPGCQGTFHASTGTIWFSYTTGATQEILTLRIKDFQVPSVLAVYTGSPGAFRLAPGACARAGGSPNNAQLAGVRLAANTTYSILLSAQTPTAGWSVDFTVTAAHLYHVTKTGDTFDGTCDADCSLREAIEAANVAATNGEAGAVIVPAGTYVLSLTGTGETDNATGDLDIRNDMAIYGAGMDQTVIDANSIDRVINVITPAQDANTLILGDLTLTHGNASDAVSRGGAIYNNPLTPSFIGLERVALVDNYAKQTGGGLDTAGSGTIRDSRFSVNVAGSAAGGALLFNPQDRPLEIESSTFDGNDGGQTGGAIQTNGNLQITNSTVSGNHVSQYGGGIQVNNGPFVMSSTTVAFNKAGSPAFWNLGGGLFLASSFNYEMFNNIIAGNTVDDCLIYNFSGGVIQSHHNHVQDPGQDGNGGCTFTGIGDVVGTDPLLDPLLANNGGPTPTHVLPFTSPAHDTGDPAGCNAPDGLPLVNDQRGAGFPRQDGRCDKGAYEQMVLFANGFEP
ncbi:MAG TPA: choice-of-anchor Q domain-containing protein [Rudaea sp.]|nr:choice-of-anchor Q domain-containing protein [Rudaea sp.]